MKILVIGGSGLVGSHVLQAAKTAGHAVTGTYHQSPQPGLVPLACDDAASCQALLKKGKPDAVVHAAGWTWVDGCEDDSKRAFAENAEQPAQMAAWCHAAGIRFVYFSTSYVFDGKAGPYTEDTAPNPINVYGRSKLQAEQDIQRATAGTALLPRVICVYGTEKRGKNFAYQVRRAMEAGQTLSLPVDQCGNPTWAGDIGAWIVKLLEQRASGIWHLAGPWPGCTRTEWAERLVKAFTALGAKQHPQFAIKSILTADLKQRALRPLQAGLLTPKADKLKFVPTDFDRTIWELMAG